MVTRKSQSETLKAKITKLDTELGKVKDQKSQLANKEKELNRQLKTLKADYIVALMAESGKSIEDLELFAKTEAVTENGGDGHVSDY
ncbi:hypothetical protein ACVRYP_04390 [Streptococcus rifensis]